MANRGIIIMEQETHYFKKKAPDSLIYRQLFNEAKKFVGKLNLVPPLTLDELHSLTDTLIEEQQELKPWKDWLMVMINNAVWQDIVASVPFQRRILLLPQCLRNSQECKAPIDEYGLLCQGCGQCELDALQNEAEELGIMCLIAEGSAVVADLLDSGSVDAVIGVSCLDALEKSFPYMVKHAIPGLAFPLYNDGCKDTETDIVMLRDAFRMTNQKTFLQLNLKTVLEDVQSLFNERELFRLLGPCKTQTDVIARNWLNLTGRRFRPFLVTAVAHCLGIKDYRSDTDLKKLAVAVECFHKASLIHDDIEDNDSFRYGQPALHKQWGVPTALNIGDFLLGEGYRLISELNISDKKRSDLLSITSTRHLSLCRGQGEELLAQTQEGCSIEKVIEIFENKTAPAFEVAIMYGLIYTNADTNLYPLVNQFSSKLGVAFQILDDLQDDVSDNKSKQEVSIIKAIEQNKTSTETNVRYEAWNMYQDYRKQTLQMLQSLENYNLKRLFFQITMRILQDVAEPA